jgi:hypothetical protein
VRRGPLAALFGLAISVLGATSVEAAGPEVGGAYQGEGYYDTNVRENVVDQRLDVGASYNHFSAGIVFLSHAPSNPRYLDPNNFGAHTEGIRKRWITASHGPVQARLGDSYATFGSGIVLRIIEDQTVDFDNVVDGGHIKVDWRRLTLEGISGMNSYGEASTMPKGLSGRWDFGKEWTAGVNGVVIDSLDGELSLPGRDVIGGAQVSGSLPGGVSWPALRT